MAVVAPLSASYPVLTVTLSLLSGERLSSGARRRNCLHHARRPARSRRREKAPDANDAEAMRRSGKGIGWALASAVGFGLLFLAARQPRYPSGGRSANGVDDFA